MLYAKFDQAAAARFGHAVKVARIAAGLTQAHVAERCGFSPKRLSFIECARCGVRPRERAALVAVLPALAALVTPPRPLVPGRPAGAYAPTTPTPEPTS